jgi:hypothetical protein
MLLRRSHDPVNVVVAGWSRLARWSDVTERRPPLAVQGFNQNRLKQVALREKVKLGLQGALRLWLT